MKTLNIVFMAASMLLATVALAGESTTKHIQIIVDDGSNSDQIVINLDSNNMGFDLEEMQEGETQSIIDESGRAILITRGADGIKIEVDGKTIEMPLLDGLHGAVMLDDVDMDIDVSSNVHVVRKHFVMGGDEINGVTIISATPIDDATRESIRAVLTASGQSGDVNFIDQTATHDSMQKIVIIRKEVTANN